MCPNHRRSSCVHGIIYLILRERHYTHDGSNEDTVDREKGDQLMALQSGFEEDSQGSDEKYAAQRQLSPYTGLQAPNHGRSKRQNEEVDQDISNSNPEISESFIDATASGDRSVPHESDGAALKNERKDNGDKVAYRDAACDGENISEHADYAENPIIEGQEGQLEGCQSARIRDLNAEKGLLKDGSAPEKTLERYYRP